MLTPRVAQNFEVSRWQYCYCSLGQVPSKLLIKATYHHRVKVGKKNQVMCGHFLKNTLWKFEKSPWEHYI
jgi:hypothetical protein